MSLPVGDLILRPKKLHIVHRPWAPACSFNALAELKQLLEPWEVLGAISGTSDVVSTSDGTDVFRDCQNEYTSDSMDVLGKFPGKQWRDI